MRKLRLLILAIAAICVMALGAFALINRPQMSAPADDDIIIKGGSLEIDCGKNQGNDCFGDNTPGKGKPKHKNQGKHITRIVVRRTDSVVVFDSDLTPVGAKPEIGITYK